MSSSAPFDQALALVHDTLLHQQANGGKAGVPVEVLQRLRDLAVPAAAPLRRRLGQQASLDTSSAEAQASAAPVMREERPAAVQAAQSPARPAGTRLLDQVRAHLPPKPEAVVPPSARSEESGDKAARMARLREQAADQLALSSMPLVFGTGGLDAEVVFIGDAPGPEEEAAGRPFVDEAGQMMTKVIAAMELPSEAVYLTNLLQTRSEEPRGRVLPPEEIALHLPYLIGQIEIIQPRCLIVLGGSTVEALLKTGLRIDRVRGQWQKYRGLPAMPTFHVAYLHSTNNPLHKRMVWEDMLQVLEHLGRPISPKQRGYFRGVRG